MDRYEYNVRLEQIRSLAEEQEFHEAMVIADSIDWRKVRSVKTLSFISEIYKINRRYEEARDILLIADSRCPNARSIIYALCELSIKMGDLNDSVGYLKEYMDMAPQDPSTYVLQYKFYALTNVGIQQRIEILEQLKNLDYQEHWGYELAKLYSEAGDTRKCIDECDRLILWFGHGRYVTEAMKLKMLYTDLTPEQQHKFDHQDAIEVLAGAEDISSDSPLSIEITDIQPSNQPTKKIPKKEINEKLGLDDIKEPSVNLDKYSTMNLQAELKKNMVDLEEKTGEPLREKEVPLPPMRDLTPMKADTDISEIIPEKEKQPAPAPREEAGDEDILAHRIPLSIKKETEERDVEKQFANILVQDYDGQISLNVPDSPEDTERQITGQMSIEDILSGWNKQKEQHEKKRLEEAKRKSLEQTSDIVNSLVNIKIERHAEPPIAPQAVSPKPEPAQAAPLKVETEKPEKTEPVTQEEAAEDVAKATPSKGMKREILEITSDLTGLLREHRERINAHKNKKKPVEEPQQEEVREEEALKEKEVLKEEEQAGAISTEEAHTEKPHAEEPEDREEENYPAVGEDEEEMYDEPEDDEEDGEEDEEPEVKAPKKYVAPKAQEVHGFDEEEKEIFAQFLPMHDLPDLIRNTLDRMKLNGKNGNVFITGNEQSARINLANALARGYMYEHPEEFVGKIARIPADLFNTKDVPDVLRALDGCALLIEHAADLTDASFEDIRKVLTKPDTSIILILEETKASYRVMERNHKKDWFDDVFDVKIEIPTYTNDDLVFHGREYAREQEYIIDDMGVLALYTKIDERQTADHFVTIDEVEKIVDEAIRHVNRKTPGHFLDVVVGKRYDDDDLIILREKDFI